MDCILFWGPQEVDHGRVQYPHYGMHFLGGGRAFIKSFENLQDADIG
jgi:hypothetical protein